MESSELLTSAAGKGGDGIAGQPAQGEAGLAGNGATGACDGGPGGLGANGGASGGGAGGISVGILWSGDAAPHQTDVTITTGDRELRQLARRT